MRFEKLTFENEGGEHLAARLDVPVDGEPVAYALFAHCFTCTKNLEAVGHISRALVQQGVAVLRFDFTGLGESEGDFSETTFSSNISDLVAAARFLERERRAPEILIGHSLGGAAVLQAAEHLPDVRAVATIAAPYDPEHVTNLFEASLEEIEREGQADVQLGGRPFTIKQAFLDDLKAGHVEETIHHLGRPLLVFHSPVDQSVGIENARLIFQAAKHPKSFVSLDHADHLLSDEADSLYVGAMLAAWVRRYLPEQQEAMKHTAPRDNVVVARNDGAGFRTEILANGFALVSDEPASVGGTATGPTPYDYLVAGLGACTVMTLRMYADRKGWPLETVTARLSHQKVHAEDCARCDAKKGKIDRIGRELELTGDLDDAQLRRLLEIADRCPVHRTLEGEVDVQTRLAGG